MRVPPFQESELKQTGWARSMAGQIPLYDFPVTQREAYLSALKDRKPVWQLTGIEAQLFTPHIIPDNVARAFVFEGVPFDNAHQGGGFDMFGVEWEYVPVAGGSMEKPGQILIEDMNDWPELLKWPDVDAWGWEQSGRENHDYLERCLGAVQIWFQTGWYERLISFMEFENAILALIDEDQEEAILAFFDKLADLYNNIMDHFVHYYPQVASFYMHDDWGSQKETFFAPEIVRKMIVPSMRKVTDHIHGLGRATELHSCGQIVRQIPNMVAAGWDTWSGQMMNDTQKAYELYGDQIMLGVIPDQFDPKTTDEETQRAMARAFAERFCRPDKPCLVNLYSSAILTPAYREELYRESRKRYGVLFS